MVSSTQQSSSFLVCVYLAAYAFGNTNALKLKPGGDVNGGDVNDLEAQANARTEVDNQEESKTDGRKPRDMRQQIVQPQKDDGYEADHIAGRIDGNHWQSVDVEGRKWQSVADPRSCQVDITEARTHEEEHILTVSQLDIQPAHSGRRTTSQEAVAPRAKSQDLEEVDKIQVAVAPRAKSQDLDLRSSFELTSPWTGQHCDRSDDDALLAAAFDADGGYNSLEQFIAAQGRVHPEFGRMLVGYCSICTNWKELEGAGACQHFRQMCSDCVVKLKTTDFPTVKCPQRCGVTIPGTGARPLAAEERRLAEEERPLAAEERRLAAEEHSSLRRSRVIWNAHGPVLLMLLFGMILCCTFFITMIIVRAA